LLSTQILIESCVGLILKRIGKAIMVCGVIAGIYYGNHNVVITSTLRSKEEFSWIPVISWSIYGFIVGMIFIGFSEVLRLLETISDSLYKNHRQKSEEETVRKSILEIVQHTKTIENNTSTILSKEQNSAD
jgi:hypothetical protein